MVSATHLLALAAALSGSHVDGGNRSLGNVASAMLAPVGGLDQATRFTLSNGLRVIVQPDRRVPIVTAIVIYNVGAKDEKPGQYGYAHLFEHLMLDGSAHWDENATKVFTDLGASGINATTTQDRTIFYETVPRGALERTLFLEADRMGHLAEALTPPKVAREVAVVLNEKRQRGGAPYGQAWIDIDQDIYPSDHPYHHGVIGDDADLHAITVREATDWFQSYYGPANATLILAGDITAEEARTLTAKYFGDLAPRAPINRVLTEGASLPGPFRREKFEAVPAARIYVTHTAPPAGSPAIADLDLIAQMLANGPTSRLHRRLVRDLGVATAVMPTFDERLLSSEMGFVVVVKSPDHVRQAEAAIDAEIARFLAEGPTPDELERARKARIGYVDRSRESTFGRAFLLMRGASLTDDPDYDATYVRQLTGATPESVKRTAEAIYGRPGHHLVVRPMPDVRAAPGGYDLAKGPPPMGAIAPVVFPTAERIRLANGLDVMLVPRPGTSTVNTLMRFDSGSASIAGPADEIAFWMLVDEGGPQASRAEALGGDLRGSIRPDFADIVLSVSASNLSTGLALLGDLVTRPALTDDRLSMVRNASRAALQREVADVPTTARILRNAVYGADHPYGAGQDPRSDLQALDALRLPAIQGWASGHIRPDRARLYIAGDTTMATLRPMLAAALGNWKGQGPATIDRPIPPASPAPGPRLIVIDKPGAGQSFIDAGRAIAPTHVNDDRALDGADGVYGHATGSRIRTTLREKKGWTYGIGSGARDARGPRMWEIAGSVDRDHTGESIAELIREMRAMTGDAPPKQAELDRIANGGINRVAAQLESNADIVQSMADNEIYGRPYDAAVRTPAALHALTVDMVRKAAGDLLDPGKMHWVIVGDWAKIRDQFKDLDLGSPVVVRAGGG